MHFERAGAENTQKTLEAVFRYVKENNVRRMMVPSRKILAKQRQF
jgi:hypothetical protein